MRGLLCVVLLALIGAEVRSDKYPDDFVAEIQKKAKTWTAGRSYSRSSSDSYIQGRLGVHPDSRKFRLPYKQEVLGEFYDANGDYYIPEEFDARRRWSRCPTISEIGDQGDCGSCWAFNAVAAMSDRLCIHSFGRQNFRFSAQDLVSCCKECGNGCNTGFSSRAWEYWTREGIVSGGSYGSNQGCRPYEIPPEISDTNGSRPDNAYIETPACKDVCRRGYYVDYKADKRFGSKAYAVEPNMRDIQREIMNNGPVQADFAVYADFRYYKKGVYQHVLGEGEGFHAVRILGWGVENGTPYWLAANSWGATWGDKGYFRILRGANHCGIESSINAGLPRLY